MNNPTNHYDYNIITNHITNNQHQQLTQYLNLPHNNTQRKQQIQQLTQILQHLNLPNTPTPQQLEQHYQHNQATQTQEKHLQQEQQLHQTTKQLNHHIQQYIHNLDLPNHIIKHIQKHYTNWTYQNSHTNQIEYTQQITIAQIKNKHNLSKPYIIHPYTPTKLIEETGYNQTIKLTIIKPYQPIQTHIITTPPKPTITLP